MHGHAIEQRAFRSEPIGIQDIRTQVADPWSRSDEFRRFPVGEEYVPRGSYIISEDERAQIVDFAAQFETPAPEVLNVAIQRLSFASIRTEPRDRLIDAVIGLEALLLAAIKGGELSFRFALNFAMLEADPAKRPAAFRTASDLYSLRNTLAHGGRPTEPIHIADRRLSLADAAKEACDHLRALLAKFLPMNAQPDYKNVDFWKNKYFGLP